MKQLWFILLLVVLFACGPASMPQEAKSTVGITAPDGYAVSCAADYIRVAPHICYYNLLLTRTALTGGFTCQAITAPGAGVAKTVLLELEGDIRSNNAVAQRTVSVSFYFDAACSNNYHSINWFAYEHVAVVANTRIGGNVTRYQIPVVVGNNNIRYAATVSGGGASQAINYAVYGYTD